jgi:superfamily I DNA/RNA helicase/mRNA-degrading endonuclease RelE of RelBE toxin-antitoxin system
MSHDRTISTKPNFLKELGKLPPNHQAQILAKVQALALDPEPDAKTRKRLKGVKDGLCRLRSGDYRVFYSFDDDSVSLYSVRIRSDDTYDSMPDAEELVHGSFDAPARTSGPTSEDFQRWMSPQPEATPLPELITEELLGALGVPKSYWRRLMGVESQEGLLGCPGVPDEFLLKIDQHMFVKPIEHVAEEPTLVPAGGVDDLLRFVEGELVTFLLKLDPDQERYVRWNPRGVGPTLLRGGPGTGKSTVALYRVREMIGRLRAEGVENPRILFATYTNALVTFSKQLLRSLLGSDSELVDVRTADSLVGSILAKEGRSSRRPTTSQDARLRREAWDAVEIAGNAVQAAAQREALGRLGPDYVFEEIGVVIEGRDLRSLEEYLEGRRPGRRALLGDAARRAVWAVHEAYSAGVERAGLETWQGARARAARLVRSGESPVTPYDAVIVDEAQDLDFNAIRLVTDLCARANRLFLTADRSQSIYPAGFDWSDIHEHLCFDTDVGVLELNHRSTRQITEAARDYLAAGLPEDLEPDPQSFRHDGPFPAVRALSDPDEEADLIARFLRGATRELRLTIGSGAVFAPTKQAGRRIADALEERGIPAAFHDSKSFELDDNAVTVLPLRAAKGLEFPVVAVAGFVDTSYPALPLSETDDSQMDFLIRERRTLFVAMTRAMRALLVVTPAGNSSMLFDGFDPQLWNTGKA